jgi:hypothetical protein
MRERQGDEQAPTPFASLCRQTTIHAGKLHLAIPTPVLLYCREARGRARPQGWLLTRALGNHGKDVCLSQMWAQVLIEHHNG